MIHRRKKRGLRTKICVESFSRNTGSKNKAISDSEAYIKTVEIREKRIGIVFKVIYVIAIFFAAVFIELGAAFGGGLTDVYIIEACVASFLLIIMFYMVGYIINEMRCLKLNQTELIDRQIYITEKSYTNIFTSLYCSGITALLCVAISLNTKNYISNQNITSVFLVTLVIWLIVLLLSTEKNTNTKIKSIMGGICCVFATIMVTCIIYIPAISVSAVTQA